MVCRVPEKLLQRSPSTLLRAVSLSNGRSDFLRRHQFWGKKSCNKAQSQGFIITDEQDLETIMSILLSCQNN